MVDLDNLRKELDLALEKLVIDFMGSRGGSNNPCFIFDPDKEKSEIWLIEMEGNLFPNHPDGLLS